MDDDWLRGRGISDRSCHNPMSSPSLCFSKVMTTLPTRAGRERDGTTCYLTVEELSTLLYLVMDGMKSNHGRLGRAAHCVPALASGLWGILASQRDD